MFVEPVIKAMALLVRGELQEIFMKMVLLLKLVFFYFPNYLNFLGDTICRSDDMCDVKAKCLYSAKDDYYKCECQAPYYGDGASCRLDPRSNFLN